MPDERKPVICPWCKLRGEHSVMTKQRLSQGMTFGIDFYFCPKCEARSPHIHTIDGNWDAAEEAAYAAATRTPPNRPLTEEQIMQCAVNVPLFCIYAKDQECRCVVFASDIQVEYKYRAEMGQMFFRDFPTPADIEAARKERDTNAR